MFAESLKVSGRPQKAHQSTFEVQASEKGMLAPPHPPAPRKNWAAPPREKQALPRPAEIDKTREAQRGKADCRLHEQIMPTNKGLEWGNEGKAFHLVFCTACDYLVCRKTI